MGYFSELIIDRTKEIPNVQGEGARRLLYMLKHAVNGSAMALVDKLAGEVVAVSPECQVLLGYTVEDLNEDWVGIFHPEDYEDVVLPHEQADLAAPYGIRMRKKGAQGQGAWKWYMVEGLTVVLEDRPFRCLIVEEV